MNTIDFVRTDLSDLACHTGVSFVVDLRVAESCTDEPNDLTGYTAELRVFDETEDNQIVAISGSIAHPETGEIHFELTPTQTSDIELGLYTYVLEIMNVGGVIYRLSQGDFEVSE